MSNKKITAEVIARTKDIARQAGMSILKIYGTDDFQVQSKEDASPLTIADEVSNQIICAGLATLPVLYPIISEEQKMVPFSERAQYDRFWMVDPLDGTKEFIKRNGEFTVNIALIEGGRPIMGVVYAPVLDEMYWATKGQGSWRQSKNGLEQLTAAEFSMQDTGLNVVCSRSHLNPETEAFIADLTDPDTVSRGSSLKFLILATGEAHLYPRIAPTMEWDTAAAQCVLEEAGGEVLQYGTDRPLEYNKEDLLNPFFLARGRLRS